MTFRCSMKTRKCKRIASIVNQQFFQKKKKRKKFRNGVLFTIHACHTYFERKKKNEEEKRCRLITLEYFKSKFIWVKNMNIKTYYIPILNAKNERIVGLSFRTVQIYILCTNNSNTLIKFNAIRINACIQLRTINPIKY